MSSPSFGMGGLIFGALGLSMALIACKHELVRRRRLARMGRIEAQRNTAAPADDQVPVPEEQLGILDDTRSSFVRFSFQEHLYVQHRKADASAMPSIQRSKSAEVHTADSLEMGDAPHRPSTPGPGLWQKVEGYLSRRGSNASSVVAADFEGGDLESGLADVGQHCSVCLDQYAQDDQLVRVTCGHDFHEECVEPWLCMHKVCPYCRTDLDVLTRLREMYPAASIQLLQGAMSRSKGDLDTAVQLLFMANVSCLYVGPPLGPYGGPPLDPPASERSSARESVNDVAPMA